MDDNDRSILSYVMGGHAMVHIYELSIPIFMTVWLTEFSTNTAILGSAVSVGYGLFGVGALPGGLLVDKYGPRLLISSCLAGMGLSFLIVSLAPSVIGLAAALACWGVAASLYHPAGLTLISNGIQDRGSGFAYHGIAGNIGIAGGPLLTAVLLLAVDWRVAAAVLSIPALLVAAAGLLIEFDPTAATDAAETENSSPTSLAAFGAESRRLFSLGFSLVFLIVAFNGLYYRGVLTFLPELLGDFLAATTDGLRLGLFEAGSPVAAEFDPARYLYVGLLLVGVGGQYLGGRLTDRIEPDRGLVGMLAVLTTIALLFVPLSTAGIRGLLAATFLLGIALFAMQPLSQATVAKYSVAESRGLSFGYTYLGIFGVGALGAAITGVVLTYGTTTMFVVLAGFSLTGGSLATILVRTQR